MKRIKIFAAALALALTSCAAQDNTALTENTSISAETVSETELSEASTESEESAAASTEVSEASAVSEKVSETTAAKAPPYENFRLSDYAEPFDEVELMPFTFEEFSSENEVDEAVLKAAADAYKASPFHSSAVENAKELGIFEYKDGKLSVSEDAMTFYAFDYPYFLNQAAAPEIEFEPVLVESFRGKLDGENEGNILIFNVPLPPENFEWSGTATFYVVIYVNSKGEAEFLDDVCQQCYYEGGAITYSDGKIHLFFNYGHTDGTSKCALYSFADDTPRCEFVDLYGRLIPLPEKSLLASNSFLDIWRSYAFRNTELEKYCGVKPAVPDPALKGILCADKTILADFPDIGERFDNGEVRIYGGTYLAVADERSYVFENGGFVPLGEKFPHFTEEFFPESFNVRLEK